jgi:genome maintenance exonuclease 1
VTIKLNPRFTYQKLERIEDAGPRLYATPDGHRVPSVTTILSQTGDKTALIEWRKRVGDEEANRISKESAGLGTLVHKHVENYITGEARPQGNNLVQVMAKNMADQIIERGLSRVTEVWGMEASLYYPGLYAGTTDLVGEYDGVPSIMDHKTAKKIKKREWIEDYFVQTCAYALAHNEVYGTNIRQGVIFMVDREQGYETFVISGSEFDHYCELWSQRVNDYYQLK